MSITEPNIKTVEHPYNVIVGITGDSAHPTRTYHPIYGVTEYDVIMDENGTPLRYEIVCESGLVSTFNYHKVDFIIADETIDSCIKRLKALIAITDRKTREEDKKTSEEDSNAKA